MFVRRHTTSLLALAATAPRVEVSFVSSFGTSLSILSALPRTETRMTSSATGEASWDAASGVWVGDKAVGFEGEVPSPLWIFGYGSLCWRPEQSFEGFDKFDGEVVGWKRLFAQKSMDHRGTPQRPGLVATVISDADLAALGKRSPGDPPSKTYGVAYRVPDDKAEEVLAGLDFREKGGYTRAIVDVFHSNDPSTNEHGKETINGVTTNCREEVDDRGRVDGKCRAAPTKALLYTATIDNPNFYLSPTMEHAAETIASSVGPSGPNHEYLFLLSEYLHQVGHPDGDLDKLSDMVKSRLDAKA